MIIGTTLLIIGILVVGIWVIIEFKRFKHKILAIFLIMLVIFTYVSFLVTIKGNDIDFKSIEGLRTAGTLYFSWLGSVFGNLKTITTHAIKMDWKPEDNVTLDLLKVPNFLEGEINTDNEAE